MGWYAKPSGAYDIESNEAQQNMFMVSEYLQSVGWSTVAIAGLLGNVKEESGFNPWRWQGDTHTTSGGYGLVQFTPSTYYIGGRGLDADFASYYAPNESVTQITSGADAHDGRAQLMTIEKYHADKFLDRTSYCDYADISSAYPYSSYKQLTNLWIATVGWLFDYEFPASENREYNDAYARYQSAMRCYEIITGEEPPEPPDPPTPPTPPTPTSSNKMPLYFYMGKRFKQKKGLIV